MVYDGKLGFDIQKNFFDLMFELLFKIMMNVGNLDCVFDFQGLLSVGVGLVCFEFIINWMIGVYLKVLLNFDILFKDVK